MKDAQLMPIVKAVVHGDASRQSATLQPQQLNDALRSGLGPLIHAAQENGDPVAASESMREHLNGTALAARMLADQNISALRAIVEACARQGLPQPILLKGISVSLQCYPAPHMRPMRDIDLLVPRESIEPFERMLYGLGYRQTSHLPSSFYDSIHHTMPHYHAETGTWIEVHKELFPPTSPFAGTEGFRAERLIGQAESFDFRGMELHCLTHLDQLAYTSAHWLSGFKASGGALPLVDMAFLIGRHGNWTDWESLLDEYADTVAAGALLVALSFLHRFGLADVPEKVLDRLSTSSHVPNSVAVRMLHAITERWMFEQRRPGWFLAGNNAAIAWQTLAFSRRPLSGLHVLAWNLAFPPARPDRYSPRFQLRRLRSAFSRRFKY